jgi:uncharacterized protein
MHIQLTSHAHAQLRPLPLGQTRLTGGLLHARQIVNRTASLKHGYRRLEQAGNFNNLRLAIGQGEGSYSSKYPFLDSDIYKWLEAVMIELGRAPEAELSALADQTIELLRAVQLPDGYLNSYYQFHKPAERWTNLDNDHELYCAGHLIEAGIAQRRATGQTSLFDSARRFADHLVETFGPDKRSGACGHPEIELALVELYRETADRRYLDLAQFFVDQRGQNRMRSAYFGPDYFQDRAPVREAVSVEGHAVRQLYLNTGVTDLYLETHEVALLAAQQRLWQDMTAHKMYLTGGVGSRGYGEAFGDPYELPSKEAYCETCAAIADLMWNWRLLLATGEARFADLIERTLYNGFLSGVALDGTHFFYENPLHSDGGQARGEWHLCACCPPNVMRQIALLDHYLATIDPTGVQLHQYARATIQTAVNGHPIGLRVDTDYPWEGHITVRVEETSVEAWALSLRIPEWCAAFEVKINGEDAKADRMKGYAVMQRPWHSGDVVTIDLPLPVRVIEPHPRIDALRGCVALERGPLVYCFEGIDQPGVNLTDLRLDPAAACAVVEWADRLGGIHVIRTRGWLAAVDEWDDRLYRLVIERTTAAREIELTAIPYFAWANRDAGQMRVWLPKFEE